MIYVYLFEGLKTGVRNRIEVQKQRPIKKVRQPLLIKDVHIVWMSIMGVNRQIRQEVYVYFWRMNTFRLRPGAVFEIKQVALQNITKVYFEVMQDIKRSSAKLALTWTSFNKTAKALLNLPSLRIADLTVDVFNLLLVMHGGRPVCRKHKDRVSKSPILEEIREDFERPSLRTKYQHFRLLVKPAEELLASGHIRRLPPKEAQLLNFPEADRNPLNLCKQVSCRLLCGLENHCNVRPGAHETECLTDRQTSLRWYEETDLCKHNSMNTPILVDVSTFHVPSTSSSSAMTGREDYFEYKFQTKGKQERGEKADDEGEFDHDRMDEEGGEWEI